VSIAFGVSDNPAFRPLGRVVGKSSICVLRLARSTWYRFDPKAIIHSTAKPLLLTTLILLSASGLSGQPPSLDRDTYGAPAVCNDGTIPFSVAQASRDHKDLLTGSDLWAVEGWFNVDPGKCTASVCAMATKMAAR